jgi:hypothetical protein
LALQNGNGPEKEERMRREIEEKNRCVQFVGIGMFF